MMWNWGEKAFAAEVDYRREQFAALWSGQPGEVRRGGRNGWLARDWPRWLAALWRPAPACDMTVCQCCTA